MMKTIHRRSLNKVSALTIGHCALFCRRNQYLSLFPLAATVSNAKSPIFQFKSGNSLKGGMLGE
jgi:hypothetical protein